MAAMLLHDALHRSKPEPGAMSDRFGGKERLEDSSPNIRRDTLAGVFDFKANVILGQAACAIPDFSAGGSVA